MHDGPLARAPWPHFDEEMIDAAERVLRSGRVNWWTGDEGRAFEREWSETFGVPHALALANGSVSLEVALRALGVGPGDEVVVTPRSYVASAACVVLVGATPVFADIDPGSQNLTAETIAAALSPRSRAVIPVHLAGWPCDMPAIMEVARRHGLFVIEDCAQAHGATIDGRPVGTFGHFGSWSFCQDKIITTGGEGGMLATHDESLFRRAWSLAQHGKSWEATFERRHPPGFRWLVESFGTNLRMTEMQAAIGRVQLRRLPAWLEARRRNAEILRRALDGSPAVRVPWPSPREGHAFYRFNAVVRPEALAPGWSRDRIMASLDAAGVPCTVGACPEIHRERAFAEAGFAPTRPPPRAAELGGRSLSLLVHPTIDDEAMRRCAVIVASTLESASTPASAAAPGARPAPPPDPAAPEPRLRSKPAQREAAAMLRSLDRLSRRQKQVVMGAADGLVLAGAVYGGVVMRMGTLTPDLTPYWPLMALAPLVGIPLFAALGLYREIVRYVGPHLVLLLAKGTIATTVVLVAASFLFTDRGALITRGSFAGFACLVMIGCGGLRLVARALIRSTLAIAREHVCIYGAGQAGAGLCSMLAADPTRAVAFMVDDEPRMQGRRIRGVPVHDPSRMRELIERHRVTTVMLALPSIGVRRRREIIDALRALGLRVLTVPTLREIADGTARIDQLRPVAIEDLLGRNPVPPDPKLVSGTVQGRSVLITGAGGSIGSELCRQVLRYRPSRLTLVDSCEFNLYSIDGELRAAAAKIGADAPPITSILATVEDGSRMEAIMRRNAVETVYHAAAYKHVPMVEHNELAGVRNNVLGTWRTAEAAEAAGARTFVLISTDKAVRPTSVMGASKRFAELILQGFASRGSPMRCVNVRFGNVLGSSGSVIPLFRRQIEEGGPVTVTHPDVTRYFMTIPEASELVLQAASMGRGGEVFVLEMGEPVRIVDLARNMVALSGRTVRDEAHPDGDIEIVFTGLRPGEKLYEELLIGRDVDGTAHPQIMRSRDDHPGWETTLSHLHELEFAIDQQDVRAVRAALEKAVPEYRPSEVARS